MHVARVFGRSPHLSAVACPPTNARPARAHGSQSLAPCHPSARPVHTCVTAQEEGSETEKLSEEYSEVMTQAMGASLHYHHEAGMNYTRILPDLIVGSCLQLASDADKLAEREGVRTVLCLQETSDQDWFSLDIAPIRERCSQRGDIQHLRHAIRDFDPFSLRRRLPSAVALLARNAETNGGTAYVHCTAGLGRAPATALAYMWWIKGIPLDQAHADLTSKRPCCPKLSAIREAAVDILYGEGPVPVTLGVLRRGTAQVVEVAGLDIGWGQKLQLEPELSTGRLVARRKLPPGTYQFKFIYDGVWSTSVDHMTMLDGDNVNNFVLVQEPDKGPEVAAARQRLRSGGNFTEQEAQALKAALAELQVAEDQPSAPGK